MQTAAFETALQKLVLLSREKPAAIMCAEAVPWRCHRSLIADALTVHGVKVLHIHNRTIAKPHSLSKMAVVSGDRITYPG